MDDEEIPAADIIDDALAAIIEEIIGEEGDIEDFDAASDVVLDHIERLANEGVISDPPDLEASDEEKQKWLDQYLPIVTEELKALGETNVDTDLE